MELKKYAHGIAIEKWPWNRTQEVKMWLVNNFGVNGGRWYEDQDFDLVTLCMDEDVYLWYTMKWGDHEKL